MLSKKKHMSSYNKNNQISESSVNFFKILKNANYFRIFRSLIESRQLNAIEIAKILKISLPAAKRYLNILKENYLIVGRESGPVVYYSLNRHNYFVVLLKQLLAKLNKRQ